MFNVALLENGELCEGRELVCVCLALSFPAGGSPCPSLRLGQVPPRGFSCSGPDPSVSLHLGPDHSGLSLCNDGSIYHFPPMYETHEYRAQGCTGHHCVPSITQQGSCTQLVLNKCTGTWDGSSATLQKPFGCLSSTYPPPFSPIPMTPPPTRGAGHDLVHAMGLHGRHDVPGALGHNCGRTLEGTESGCH